MADTISKMPTMELDQSCSNKIEHDWIGRMNDFLQQAKEANDSFNYEQAIESLNSMENIWESIGLPEFSPELKLQLYQEKGRALASLGRYNEAIEEYLKIPKFCSDSSQLPLKSETFTQIGQLLAKMGEHDRALGYLQRAIGAYRRLGEKAGICRALRNLGVVYVELGEFEEAESTYDEAIEIARETDDRKVFADLINNLGTIMNMKGNWQRALKLYRESLEIYESENEIRKSAYTKNNIAITCVERGLEKDALKYFEEAHVIAGRIKDGSLKLIVDINLADLNLKLDQVSEAKEYCHEALQYLDDADLTNNQLVEAKKIAGMIAHKEQDYTTAQTHFAAALEISHQIGAQFLEAEVLLERGRLFKSMEKHFDSLADMESSYHIYSRLKADGKREQAEVNIKSLEKLYLEIFYSMAKLVDRKDKYTKGHSDRVASLALLLGRELGFRDSMLKTVVAAGLLHDIGKINIDDEILKKAGKLTDDEYREIKKHPELGVKLLAGKEFPWDFKPLVMYHHEKLDGTGYPWGLKGDDIPLGARIICIADVFDALTSDRVYRPAFEIQKALDIMHKEIGSTFDPMLLQCFTDLINDGKADQVINSQTREDEMYDIWSQCMTD